MRSAPRPSSPRQYRWLPRAGLPAERREAWAGWQRYVRTTEHALVGFERGLRAYRAGLEHQLRARERSAAEALVGWADQGDWSPMGLERPARSSGPLARIEAEWAEWERRLLGPASVGAAMALARRAVGAWLTKRFSPPNPLLDEVDFDPSEADDLIEWFEDFVGSMRRDMRWNIRGIIFNTVRGMREQVARVEAGVTPRQQAVAGLRRMARANRNVWRLSTEAHARAVLRRGFYMAAREAHAKGAVAQGGGALGFAAALFVVLSPRRESAKGETGRLLYRVLTHRQLTEHYRRLNAGRRSATAPWGLGLHHGSREVYVPVPVGLDDEARMWAGELREDLLDEGWNFDDDLFDAPARRGRRAG